MLTTNLTSSPSVGAWALLSLAALVVWTIGARHGEPEPVDPLRFRLRILDSEVERRAVEVTGTEWPYSDADRGTDFPGGCEGARFAVSQLSIHGLWGAEAVAPLCEGSAMP